MDLIYDILFWISVYVAFHLYVRLYQLTFVEVFPNIFSRDSISKKYMKKLSIKLDEKRISATLIVYSVIAILPMIILSLLVGSQMGLIIWAGTTLFISLFLIPLEQVVTYRSTKDKKEKLLQLNSELKDEPSTPVTQEMFNLLISGFNSEEEEICQLTLEALDLLKDNEIVIEKLLQSTVPRKSIYERLTIRKTPSTKAVWNYLKKIDHLPAKRRGENVQRLSDEI